MCVIMCVRVEQQREVVALSACRAEVDAAQDSEAVFSSEKASASNESLGLKQIGVSSKLVFVVPSTTGVCVQQRGSFTHRIYPHHNAKEMSRKRIGRKY